MENGNGLVQPKGGTNHHGRPVQRYMRVAMGSWNTLPPFCAKPLLLLITASKKLVPVDIIRRRPAGPTRRPHRRGRCGNAEWSCSARDPMRDPPQTRLGARLTYPPYSAGHSTVGARAASTDRGRLRRALFADDAPTHHKTESIGCKGFKTLVGQGRSPQE